jgi:hypothetical protein
LGREKVKEIQALYSAIPPYTNPNAYVDYTVNHYNPGLYGVLVPAFVGRIIALTPHDDRNRDPVKNATDIGARSLDTRTNELFGSWARAAVMRRPLDYLAHSILHFWGLWRDSVRYYYSLGDTRHPLLLAGFELGEPRFREPGVTTKEYRAYNDSWRQQNGSTLLAQLHYKLFSRSGSTPPLVHVALMVAALVLSFLYLLPRKYSPGMAAAIIWALFINAYFAGHSLFQVTLVRYGEVIVLLIPLFYGLLLATIGPWVASIRSRRQNIGGDIQPAR